MKRREDHPMFKRLQQLDSELELEEIKSEFQRSALLILLFFIILVVAAINFWTVDHNVASFYGGSGSFGLIISWIIAFLVYQFMILFYLRSKIFQEQKATTAFKFIHTVIEISIPSAVIFYMMHNYQMLSFLESPVSLVYFLFIILSILHVDYRVSLFTGVLAALHYAALTYYGFNYVDAPEQYQMAVPVNSHYIRTIILILCGSAAAYVSADLKKRMKMAYDFRKEKSKLELLFGQHVSKEVSKALIEEKGATKRLEATVMFLDIRNFTHYADSHSPDEVVNYQNHFFGPVIDIINQHQGVVLQLLGDGVMACFGTPVENTLHADMAFQASIAILKQVKTASDSGQLHPTAIGIGLHSGPMVAGSIGNEHRKQFSITGAPVIVASRIEQLNKKYHSEFLISGEVFQRITPGKTSIRFLGEELLKGIEKPVSIYQVGTLS